MKVPIVGGFSYMTMVSKQAEGFTFNDLGILGLAVAGFAVFGFVVSLIRLHYLNFIPAGIGIIAVAATMMKFWSIKSEMTANMKRDLEGNPFAGIGTIMTEAFQLDFGIGVIAVAAMLLIGAGACGVLMNPTR